MLSLAMAAAGTRVMGALLFDVEPTDPVTSALAACALAATSLAATCIPAWRATRVLSVSVLRAD